MPLDIQATATRPLIVRLHIVRVLKGSLLPGFSAVQIYNCSGLFVFDYIWPQKAPSVPVQAVIMPERAGRSADACASLPGSECGKAVRRAGILGDNYNVCQYYCHQRILSPAVVRFCCPSRLSRTAWHLPQILLGVR